LLKNALFKQATKSQVGSYLQQLQWLEHICNSTEFTSASAAFFDHIYTYYIANRKTNCSDLMK